MQAPLWERFAEPAADFSPTPLWWWSGDTVTAERLRWQLERLAAGGGFYSVVVKGAPPRPPLRQGARGPPLLFGGRGGGFGGAPGGAGGGGARGWVFHPKRVSGADI